MEHENLHVISFGFAGISAALILWRGCRFDMILRYPLVYAYVAVSLLREAIGEVLLRQLDLGSPSYVLSYACLSLVHAAFGIAVLLRIYYLGRKPSLAADWHFVGFLALILTRDFFWADGIWISYRLLTAAQITLTYLAICALARLFFGGMLYGWNLSMALLGITLPSAFRSIILSQYLFAEDTLSYSFTVVGMELSMIGAWAILVVGLWEYSPPIRVNIPRGVAGKNVHPRTWAEIKALWGLR